MNNKLLAILCIIALFSCNSNTNIKANKVNNHIIVDCSKELTANVEIWSNTGKENLIGEFSEVIKDEYVQCLNGWDRDNFPYPKKFDVKLKVVNNLLAYEQVKPQNLSDFVLNVNLKLKVGQSPNSFYPLNSQIKENIEIVKDRTISEDDFIDHAIQLTIWKKNIPFEIFYKKYSEKGLFINQLVFEINFCDKNNEKLCSYEYVFPMAERGE